jgi:molybdate transport system substrate-binding protein
MKRQHLTVLALAVTTGAGAIACGSPLSGTATNTPTSEATLDLTVSAAASVQDALYEVQAAYAREAPEVAVTYNFGSSGSLAQQIAQGAPADVFLSASPRWMNELDDKGQLLDGSRQDLLRNDIVLVVPTTSAITQFPDLATDGVDRVAIGEPDSVPAGQYGREVLTAFNLLDKLQPKLVFAKDVRQVLSYVETGNVDAGLVYATDARMSDQVQIAAISPVEAHTPIVYPVAVVADSQQAAAARGFVAFLSSDTAADIFQSYGFNTID